MDFDALKDPWDLAKGRWEELAAALVLVALVGLKLNPFRDYRPRGKRIKGVKNKSCSVDHVQQLRRE